MVFEPAWRPLVAAPLFVLVVQKAAPYLALDIGFPFRVSKILPLAEARAIRPSAGWLLSGCERDLYRLRVK